jgi:hypothetical protein
MDQCAKLVIRKSALTRICILPKAMPMAVNVSNSMLDIIKIMTFGAEKNIAMITIAMGNRKTLAAAIPNVQNPIPAVTIIKATRKAAL